MKNENDFRGGELADDEILRVTAYSRNDDDVLTGYFDDIQSAAKATYDMLGDYFIESERVKRQGE